jgi:hypothetical protein
MRLMRTRNIALLALSCCSTSAFADLAADYAALVTESSYTNFLNQSLYTHNGNSRKFNSGANRTAARDNILNHFGSAGLQSSLESFTYSGATGWNVVGVLPGRVTPQNVYLVGAHWDSTSPSTAAPGADDNASGTAGVMEAAKALGGKPFESTIVFVAFDAEEVGLIGSKRYVTAHAGQNVKAAIAMDMIAYNPATNHDKAYVYYKYANTGAPLANALSSAFTQYGSGIVGEAASYTTYDMTDHAPFANAGYPAVAVLEYNVWSNPRYHTAQDSFDTPNYIDPAYGSKITRAVTGFLAGAAGALVTGDLDLDDDVDFDDLLGLAQHYGASTGGTWQTGDFTGEGAIDFDDLLQLAQTYGTGTALLTTDDFQSDWSLARSLVPEPTTLALTSFALAFAVPRRRC